MSARTAFIREEKVNTINCRLGKRNRETAVAISSSNNDQARPYYGAPEKLWRILVRGQAAIPIDILRGLDARPGLKKARERSLHEEPLSK